MKSKAQILLIPAPSDAELPVALLLAAMLSFLVAAQLLVPRLPYFSQAWASMGISVIALYLLINIVRLILKWFMAPVVDVSYRNINPYNDAEQDDEVKPPTPPRHYSLIQKRYRETDPQPEEPVRYPIYDDNGEEP